MMRRNKDAHRVVRSSVGASSDGRRGLINNLDCGSSIQLNGLSRKLRASAYDSSRRSSSRRAVLARRAAADTCATLSRHVANAVDPRGARHVFLAIVLDDDGDFRPAHRYRREQVIHRIERVHALRIEPPGVGPLKSTDRLTSLLTFVIATFTQTETLPATSTDRDRPGARLQEEA